MPNWFKIPARYISGGAEDGGGIAVAINLDSIAFVIQDTARDGKPILKITTTSGQPLDLHGVSLEAFLALSRVGFSAEPTGERTDNEAD